MRLFIFFALAASATGALGLKVLAMAFGLLAFGIGSFLVIRDRVELIEPELDHG